MSKSQVEIVQNAERLASNLRAGPVVTKNALLAVVGTFMSDTSGDIKRLSQIMELLEERSGGHLKRGGGFGEQVRLVIQEVGRLLDRGEWQPQELKSLFGWTARLLLVRQEHGTRSQRSGTGESEHKDSQESRPSREQKRPLVPPAKPFQGGVSGKNRNVLEEMRRKLSGSDKKDT